MKVHVSKLLAVLLATQFFVACETNSKGSSGDEAQIRASIAAYEEAYARGDAKALAQLWAKDASYVHPVTGGELKGRDAIEQELQALFDSLGEMSLKLTTETISFDKAGHAVEIGSARVSRSGEEEAEMRYRAEYIHEDNKWLLHHVSEVDVQKAPTHHPELQQLDWLLGEWVDDSDGVSIQTSCSWDENKNFLTREFVVTAHGKETFRGHQVIGWDAARQQILTWTFDSDGGFSEGVAEAEDGKLTINARSTLPDGAIASSINIHERIDDNSFSWRSVGREVDGEIQPNLGPVTVMRTKG